jgi:hypothetical protein
VQLAGVALARQTRSGGNTESVPQILQGFVHQVVNQNFFGVDRDAPMGPTLLTATLGAAMVAAIGSAGFVAWRRGDRVRGAGLFAIPSGALALYLFSITQGTGPGFPSRYALVPAWCVIWALLVATETLLSLTPPADTSRSWQGLTACVVCVALVASWTLGWQPEHGRGNGPTWSASLDTARQQCAAAPGDDTSVAVAVMPIRVPQTWNVVVRCSQIT